MANSEMKRSGTMIRGADGALYFIPDEEIDGYRVPEEVAAPVREILDRHQNVTGNTQENLEKGILLALHGPFGESWIAGPQDPTVLVAATARLYLEGLSRRK